MPDERRPRSPTETHYPNLDVFEMTRKSWNKFKYLFVQNYEFRTRMMENVTPVDLNVLSWTFGVELSNHEQPCRSGSTNVSNPILVNTPGRLAAASRCISKRIPDGTL